VLGAKVFQLCEADTRAVHNCHATARRMARVIICSSSGGTTGGSEAAKCSTTALARPSDDTERRYLHAALYGQGKSLQCRAKPFVRSSVMV